MLYTLTLMLGFDMCQGQAAQRCQQSCQPCKTQKGPWADRKSQSAESAPELTQAVLAINLLKCAYLDFYQLPPLFFIRSHFPLSNTKDVNPEGTVAGHGLKRLKQTHSSSFRWWDMTSSFFLTIFSYFLSHWLTPLVPALSEMTSFLLKMRDVFRQDGSLTSVCSCLVFTLWSWLPVIPTPKPHIKRDVRGFSTTQPE